jgi:tetratricopeptide (TPR) repeat protein
LKYVSVILAGLLACGGAVAASAPRTVQPSPDPDLANPGRTYEYCIQLSKTRPDQALELASKWGAIGGGDGAGHCRALALIGLKDYGQGARELEDLAQKSKAAETLRADLLEQAGQAWLLQGEPTRAYNAQTAGLKIAPEGSPQHLLLLVDRAATLAEGAKFQEAVVDLDAALALQPDHSDALAFRATARRNLGQVDAALVDAEHAVKSDPKNVNALLERSNIYRMKGRLNEARQDWVMIVQLAPDSDAAKAARADMERADVKPDGIGKKP